MNRRSFLGVLAAIPAAAVAGVRLKSKWPWYFGKDLLHRPTATATGSIALREWARIVGEVKYEKAFLAQAGEEFGKSFQHLKTLTAAKTISPNPEAAGHDDRCARVRPTKGRFVGGPGLK